MASKKVTLFLVPDGTNKIRQFSFPRFLPAILAVIIGFSSAFFIWLIIDYKSLRVQIPRLAWLEKEHEKNKNQFIHLANRIDQVTQKVGELNEFDRKLKIMVNLETGDEKDQFQGVGGSEPIFLTSDDAESKSHQDLVRSMHRSLDRLESEIYIGEQDKNQLHTFLENQKMLLACTPSIWPTKGWMSSSFGYRKSPFTGEKEFHKGIDIATRMGAPIISPADGFVSSIETDRGYGRMLTIKHGYGLMTRYAHLKSALVKKGQYVKRGETIALVGNSGRSTGPHLHYEVFLNNVRINPTHYILN